MTGKRCAVSASDFGPNVSLYAGREPGNIEKRRLHRDCETFCQKRQQSSGRGVCDMRVMDLQFPFLGLQILQYEKF